MTTSQPSSRDISRKLVALIFGANFFGALIIFLYFSVIDPLPVGGVAVRSLETEDIVTFGIAGVVIFVGAFAILNRLGRPIQNWLRLIEAGTPATELPSSVARLVLIWPLIVASLVAATGLLVAIFFSVLYDSPGNFVGIAISGAVTTTVVYFGTDLIWRQQVPTFSPKGI